MSEKRTLEIVFAGATLLITCLGVYVTWKSRKLAAGAVSAPAAGAAPPVPASPLSGASQSSFAQLLPGQLKTIQAPGNNPPPVAPPKPSASQPSSAAATNALIQQGLSLKVPGTGASVAGVGGYAAVKTTAAASASAGNALKTVATPGSPEENATFAPTSFDPAQGSFQNQSGDALKSFSGDLSAAAGGAGVAGIATFAVKAIGGIRGKTQSQQAATWGQSVLAGVEGIVGSVPIFGQIAAPLIGVGAGTYEGKRAVAEAGRITEQGYNAQKDILAGDVSAGFSGGGTSHKERVIAAEAQQKADAAKLSAGQSAESARNAAAIAANTTGSAWQQGQNAIAATNLGILKTVGNDPTKLTPTQYTQIYGDAQTNANRAAADAAAQKANDAATAAIAAQLHPATQGQIARI